MTPDIALQQLRNIAERLHASGCHWRSERITESAEAIEAAMREPVAEVFDTMPRRILWETVAIRDSHPPGTKLYAFPPHAAMEVRRLNYRLSTLEEDRLERDAKIERLREKAEEGHRALMNLSDELARKRMDIQPLREAVQERDGVLEMVLLRELRLRELLTDAQRVLEWGEPEPKPVLRRIEAALNLTGKEDKTC